MYNVKERFEVVESEIQGLVAEYNALNDQATQIQQKMNQLQFNIFGKQAILKELTPYLEEKVVETDDELEVKVPNE